MKKVFSILLISLLLPAAVFAAGQQELPEGPVEIEFLAQWEVSPQEIALGNEVAEKTGTVLKYNVAPNNEQRNLIATRMAAGNLPDLFFIEDVEPYKDGYEGGLFANLSAGADRLGLANIKAEIKEVENVYGDFFAEDDGYYRLPARRMKAYGWYWLYRKDWADAAGLSYKPEMDDFIKFAEAMMAGNPGSVGFTAYGAWAPVSAFGSAFSGQMPVQWNPPCLTPVSGDWECVETSDRYREGLKVLNYMYKNEVMDPEIFSMDQVTAIQKFVQGKSAMLIGNSPHADSIASSFYEANPNGEIAGAMYAPKGPYSSARGGSTGYYKSWVVSANAKEDYTLKFLNEFKSAESLAKATRSEGWDTAGGGHGDHTWAEWMGQIVPDWSKVHPTLADGLSKADDEVAIQDPRLVEYASEVFEQYKPEVASYIQDGVAKFITGADDIHSDADWEAYVAGADKAGLQKLIDDISAYYR
ncbi:MAG: extracellular solute-binding protein [Spirochaetales bacterium]|nr:extracellular solute-binding protein [Spirochaetales bacterium]